MRHFTVIQVYTTRIAKQHDELLISILITRLTHISKYVYKHTFHPTYHHIWVSQGYYWKLMMKPMGAREELLPSTEASNAIFAFLKPRLYSNWEPRLYINWESHLNFVEVHVSTWSAWQPHLWGLRSLTYIKYVSASAISSTVHW